MITKEKEIQDAATAAYNEEISLGASPLYAGGVKNGFVSGAKWMGANTVPEIEQMQTENIALEARNARLRDALTNTKNQITGICDVINGGKVPPLWKNIIKDIENALK